MKTGYRAGNDILIFVLTCIIPPGAMRGHTQAVPLVTVCDVLKDLPAYKGRTVIVVGRSKSTMEGSWLDQDCPTKLITDGYEWSTSISLSYIGTESTAPSMPTKFH